MRHLALLLLAALIPGCGGGPKAPKPSTKPRTVQIPKGPFAADARLVWSADGRSVLVDDEWRLEPDSGRFVPVASRLPKDPTLITSSRGKTAAVTPTKITVIDGGDVEVPSFLEGGAAPERVVAAFIDDDRIYVHQQGGGGDACRIRVLAENRWALPSGGCVEPDGPLLELIRGPGAVLGVRTAADTRVQYYDPRRAKIGLKAPPVAEPARLSFGPHGGTAWVVSRCAPGAKACATTATRRFEVDLIDGTFADRGAAVQGAVPGPGGGMAWIVNGSVCLGTSLVPLRCVKP